MLYYQSLSQLCQILLQLASWGRRSSSKIEAYVCGAWRKKDEAEFAPRPVSRDPAARICEGDGSWSSRRRLIKKIKIVNGKDHSNKQSKKIDRWKQHSSSGGTTADACIGAPSLPLRSGNRRVNASGTKPLLHVFPVIHLRVTFAASTLFTTPPSLTSSQ